MFQMAASTSLRGVECTLGVDHCPLVTFQIRHFSFIFSNASFLKYENQGKMEGPVLFSKTTCYSFL